MNPQENPVDYNQPVAYDAEGRPLYAHPPKASTGNAAITAAQVTPVPAPVPDAASSADAARRHETSKQLYPELNLSEGEYVVEVIYRHVIGLVAPIVIGVLLIALFLSIAVSFDQIALSLGGIIVEAAGGIVAVLYGLALLIGLGVAAVAYVFTHNKFYLTNESVVQRIQTTLFAHTEQTMSLANIQDVKFSQDGILSNLFDYGTLEVTNETNQSVYKFTYAAHPKQYKAAIHDAVEKAHSA